MGKQKAPPAPDYAAAATAQGQANLTAGQQTAALNRPNQVDSNGSQTWSMREGADPKNPQAGDWTVTNALNPTQQVLKDQQDALSKQYGGLASGALNTVGNTMAQRFDTSGLPQAQQLTTGGLPALQTGQQGLAPNSSANPGQMAPSAQAPTSFERAPDASQFDNGPGVNGNRAQLSTEGLNQFGQVDPTSEASRQRITDALYRRQTSMLDPQTHQQSSDLTSQLAAQGITEGSEAFNRAKDNLARQQAEAYSGARDSAILAGGAEDSRIGQQNLNVAQFNNATRGQQFDEQGRVVDNQNANIDSLFNQGMQSSQMGNQNKQQIFQQLMAQAGFNNDAQDTQFKQGLAALGYNRDSGQQLYDRQMQSAAFDNTNKDKLFSQQMQLAGQNNANRAQLFNEDQNMTSANNTLHSNAVQEALMQRELGMNEANALRTGNQVGGMQFQPYGGGGQIQAAPMYQSTADQYNAQLAGVNANNAATGGIFSGLTKLGAAYIGG